MRLIVSAFALFALLPVATAQIGLSQKEAISRYGKPVATGKHSTMTAAKKVVVLGPWLSFRFGSWSIRCDFVEDRCVRTAYGPGSGPWNEADVQRILATNAQGETWTNRPPPDPKFHKRAWRRSDGATATLSEFTGLSIATLDYQRARLAAGADQSHEGWAGPGPISPKTEPNKSPEPTSTRTP